MPLQVEIQTFFKRVHCKHSWLNKEDAHGTAHLQFCDVPHFSCKAPQHGNYCSAGLHYC